MGAGFCCRGISENGENGDANSSWESLLHAEKDEFLFIRETPGRFYFQDEGAF